MLTRMVPHNEGPNLGWRGGTLGTGDVDLGDDRNRLGGRLIGVRIQYQKHTSE
jgi:hypothetical protein